jgi:hypothetical protein
MDTYNDDEEFGAIELEPGDLAIVVRDDGETEAYFTNLEGDESDEQSARVKYLAELILFAITNEQCREIFARAQAPSLN